MSELNSKIDTNSSRYTILFMVALSFICALILSVLASVLSGPQEVAKELDRSRQMLIAARIISPYGYFEVQNDKGEYIPAQYTKGGILIPADKKIPAGRDEILDVYNARIKSFLVDDKGNPTTFKEAGIDEAKYTLDYRSTGYYLQPLKLIYKILPNPTKSEVAKSESKVEGYVIPINGMGLWDAIYGYLAIKPDAETVIGISWYDQKETPGLGAVIVEPEWQSQFYEKKIFQQTPGKETDFAAEPLGLTVVKGKANEVLGSSPKLMSAVDGIAGSTLTGNGVTNAYKDVLSAYRPFFIRIKNDKK